jgi:hypothetical protein
VQAIRREFPEGVIATDAIAAINAEGTSALVEN